MSHVKRGKNIIGNVKSHVKRGKSIRSQFSRKRGGDMFSRGFRQNMSGGVHLIQFSLDRVTVTINALEGCGNSLSPRLKEEVFDLEGLDQRSTCNF